VVPDALAGHKKGAATEGRTLVWVDEAGFYLLPAAVRTYAPRGQTPLLRGPLTRDHLAVIGGITPTGQLLLCAQPRPYRGADVARFLRHLVRHVPGQLTVIWDGAPIHRGQSVRAFLASEEGARLRLEALPGYAPELNPAEGIWNYLERVELRNRCCASLTELRREVRLAATRLRRKPHVIRGCIAEAGYHV